MTPTTISGARMREQNPQTHWIILDLRLLVVAAAGILHRVEYVILGMTDVAMTLAFRKRVRTRLEIRPARATARCRRLVEL